MFSNTDDFIKKSNKVHNNKFIYDKTEYINNKTHVIITCPVHGDFNQSPQGHLSGYGCVQCYERKSKPEMLIEQFLKEHNISYSNEVRFEECKNIYTLPFDFYIEDSNLIIEYDGKHHFEPIECWGGIDTLNRVQNNDKIKNQYCVDNNIKLVRINYKQNLLAELNKLFNK